MSGSQPLPERACSAPATASGFLKYRARGVYNRVNGIRGELDGWTQREYNHDELPSEQFFDLYYHECGSSFVSSDIRN
ncbi:MAG: DUF5623 domain-containing protein [Rubrivivax sp.]|nr:DUF5623 domain-containing protein [Rubrivivax sp.]